MRVFRLGLFMVAGCAALAHAVMVQAQVPPPGEQKPAGQGFFINGGDTLREGVEVAANYA